MSKKKFVDDNHTIVDMSLTKNTSWYNSFGEIAKRNREKRQEAKESEIRAIPVDYFHSKKEERKFIFSALLAGLSIALVFVGGFYLFILFCLNVWFK